MAQELKALHSLDVRAVIPALNEEKSIGDVIRAMPSWFREVIVVDNGSSDATAAVARSAGARVVCEPRKGYGAACLAGVAAAGVCDVIVFLDADGADAPAESVGLVAPIAEGVADLVIGARIGPAIEAGALTPPQRIGNAFAGWLIGAFWGVRVRDLGPFRAIRFDTLRQLRMTDRAYGWTAQMQARAARLGVRMIELPVSYRRRVGKSKISGTVRGVILAGAGIIGAILRERFAPPR